MKINKKTVAEKIAAYLHQKISLPELVHWAEASMMEGEFDERQINSLREVIGRLGLADVRAFGLTWEDCEQLLKKLGYTAKVEIVAA
jgi:hypothetical protein